MFAHAHLLVDPGNFTLSVDVDSPTLGERPNGTNETIGLGSFLGRIAQDGIIEIEFLGKSGILINRIDARCEVGDVLELLQLFTTLTE